MGTYEDSSAKEIRGLCAQARDHWAAGRADAAIRDAWSAYRLQSQDTEVKVLLASLIGAFPSRIAPEMGGDLVQLLKDQDVAPEYVSLAGWMILLRDPFWRTAATNGAFDALAARLEADDLALTLLAETPVELRDAEILLTMVRRWLLQFEQWPNFPRLVDALRAQTALNGGAWPFSEDERSRLKQDTTHAMSAAYLRSAVSLPRDHVELSDPVMRAVAEDYERWPYPEWQRTMTRQNAQRLPDQIKELDPEGPDCLRVNAKILVAGCGTGSEVAQVVREYPDAVVTAIDLSEASLNYARRQCAAQGLNGIKFQQLDLHKVSALKEQFDAIFCSGVLHHIPDPERGWTQLAGVLRSGGVMRIMLYSKAARAFLAEARTLISDLVAEPMTDDVIRSVRRRFIERSGDPRTWKILNAAPFATLSGTHDLLLHRREDPFDIPRIAQALERLRLRLIYFAFPTPDSRTRYETMFPYDRRHRDLRSLAMFERREPSTFLSQYTFWCRSEAFWLQSGPAPRRA